MNELAGIVARDAAYTAGFPTTKAHLHAALDAAADRRALLALLRPIGNWYATTHSDELGHDHHCPIPTNGAMQKPGAVCTCGWTEAQPALDVIAALDEPTP